MSKLNELLVNTLIDKNLTISFSESFTGGEAAKLIVDVPHASNIFLGSIVAYNEKIKEEVLGVKKDTIDKYSVDSKEVVIEMALCALNKFKSDIAVSFSGEAGPISYIDNISPGTIFIAIAYKDKEVDSYEFHLKGSRNEIREEACNIAFQKILEKI